MSERHARGQAEFARWHKRASDFLMGAAFYRSGGNAPMAALLLLTWWFLKRKDA